jgi:hypothetical protein
MWFRCISAVPSVFISIAPLQSAFTYCRVEFSQWLASYRMNRPMAQPGCTYSRPCLTRMSRCPTAGFHLTGFGQTDRTDGLFVLLSVELKEGRIRDFDLAARPKLAPISIQYHCNDLNKVLSTGSSFR